ncbi:unnamed protein product [Closterium sp. Yama58-4]|nr:unnamed protein product [Closterium sp. Yama58-4]
MESPEIVAEFVAITAQPERVARQYLEAHNWDLQLAVNFFLEHGGDEGGGLGNGITDAIDLTSEPPPAAATTRPRTFHEQPLGGEHIGGAPGIAGIAGMQQQQQEQAQEEEYENLNPVRPFMTGTAFDRLMRTSRAPVTARAPSSGPIISEPREVREIPIQWDDAASNGNGSAGGRGYTSGGGQRGLGGGQGFGEGRGVGFDEAFDRGYGRRAGSGPFGFASQQQQELQQWNQSGGVRIEEVEDGDDGAGGGAGAGRAFVQEPGVNEAVGAGGGAGMGGAAGGGFAGEAEEAGHGSMAPASAAAPMDVDQDEDDDVMRAIALSIKTAEEEAALRGQAPTALLQPPFAETGFPETAPVPLAPPPTTDEEYFKSLIADQEKEERSVVLKCIDTFPLLRHPLSYPPTCSASPASFCDQDEEYFKSLIADQEKEEAARRKEEEERQRRQQEEQERQDELRRQREQEEEAQRQLAAKEAALPVEPAAGEEGAITLMLRLPDGSRLSRRFLISNTLEALFDYVDVSRRVKPNTYTIARQYPRRVFEPAEAHATLADLGITSKQEALYIQQL